MIPYHEKITGAELTAADGPLNKRTRPIAMDDTFTAMKHVSTIYWQAIRRADRIETPEAYAPPRRYHAISPQ